MPCCSLFSRGKTKSAGRKDETNTQTAPPESMPTVLHEPPSTQPAAVAEPVNETPTNPEPETKEPQQRDLWKNALEQLPQSKQDTLKKMGFDKLTSGSMASNIDDLVNLVNKKQEECESKFWRVNIGGEDVVLRDYTTSIIGWLEKAGDIAIQFAPPQASLPWSLIKNVMQIPVNESEQMGALLATTEKIVRITSRGQVYEQVYLPQDPGASLDSIQQSLESALTQIYASSLDLLAESGKLFSSGTARRTLEAIINPGKMSGSLADLAAQEDELLRDIQACESRRSAEADDRMIKMLQAFNDPLTRMDEGINHLLEHMNEGDRIEMLEWISSVPFGKHHDNVKEKRTPGTGEWLLRHKDFRYWEEKKSSALFWLQGSPGTGKTYLTSTVIDRVRRNISNPPKDEGFAFFYCDKNEKTRSQPLPILQSFVRQLSTAASSPESIQSKLRETCKEARENGTNFRPQQCKDQILASLDIYQSTTLVIDALDECDPDTRDELIDALNSFMSKSPKPLKVFISSRPEPDFQNQFESSPNVSIQADDNRDDIKRFLDIELDKLGKKAAVLKRLKNEIIAKLLERCQGMFQWAALQVHQIVKCRTESSVWKRLDNLPDDLQNAYDEVWTEIEALEEPDQTLAKRALLWVMAACKPMTSDEILSAIRLDSNGGMFPLADMIDEQGLLSLCNNFLTIDSQLNVWRFPHLSVMEYLQAKENWSLSRAHYYVASTCLSYFVNTYERLELMPEGATDPEEAEQPGESDDSFDTMHPFNVYMRHCWPQHVHGAKETQGAELSSLLKTFLGSPNESTMQYRKWVQQTEGDFDHFIYREEFQYYEEAHLDNDSARDIISELFPEDASIFAMCRLSLATILSDWWESADIDVSRVNSRNHNLVALAARAGCIPACKKLIDRGMDVNARIDGYDHGSALVAAAAMGHTETVKYLVQTGADVNMLLEGGNYPCALEAAIYCESVQTVKYLVEEALADINIPLRERSTGHILGEAALAPGLELMKILLNAGADVNTRLNGYYTESPLAIKIWKGEFESVKYLVKAAGADVNMPLQNPWGNALEAAAHSQDVNVVRFLVEEGGAKVNSPSTGGKFGSPLAAACHGALENVKYLVEAGADINMQLPAGIYGSALTAAAMSSKPWNVKYLVKSGADVNMSVQSGEFGSALAGAVYEGEDLETVKFLIEAGADVNKALEYGDYGSALAAAGAGKEYGDEKVFPYLIQAGADVNMPLEHGLFGSALAAAAWRRIYYKLEILLNAGADLNMVLKGRDFGSALAIAAAFSNDDGTVDTLLEAGADANLKHPEGRYASPLIAAACFGQTGAVEALIKAGADVDAKFEGSPYVTALHAAKADMTEEDKVWLLRACNGNEMDAKEIGEEWTEQKADVVKLLQKHGATG